MPLGDVTLRNMIALNATLFQQTNLQLRIWFNDGVNGFAALSPLQNLTTAPYAAVAGSLSARSKSDGGGLTNVNAATLDGVSRDGFWETSGNAGASGATLGTTDGFPLELKVNGQRALRLEAGFDSGLGVVPNLMGGVSGNSVELETSGCFIGGGGRPGAPNTVNNSFASVVGGFGNVASGLGSTVMGAFCTASGLDSTAMGLQSTATGATSTAMGFRAKALHNGTFVWADGQAIDFASTGINQFCVRASGGVQLNPDTSLFFGSQTRQMLNLFGTAYGIGVQGGTEYFRTGAEFRWYKGGAHSDTLGDSGSGGSTMMILNNVGLSVNGTFVSASDRKLKENFKPVSVREVLDKVAALPISRWNYKADTASEHLGPMAQDFYAAFNVGMDDKHIATIDESGVALAAIQGLNEKVEIRSQKSEARMQTLEEENADLKKELADLRELVERLGQPRKEN